MEELKGRFPEGLDYAIVYDTTPFITESIHEVFKTLRDAVILVAVVVLLFLQNWRSALIPLVAVPVAIVGTFAVMAALGFSLNNLTLFGLVLAIGIVVDDAIVVVEAVEHHIEHGLTPRDATDQGDGRGLRAGHRHRPGADGGVRPVRVHPRHHRPVLPPVRPDDRRLDADLGLQLADAQPALAALLLQAADRKGERTEAAAEARLRPGGRLPRLPVPHAATWDRTSGRSRRADGGWPGRSPRSIGAVAGWLVGPLLNWLLSGFFRLFNVGFQAATGAYTGSSAGCSASACSCCSSTAACCT